ncbi:MAG: LLM class flavin-dependent oxidoreductase [Pirellulales bacterium]|nr:LLM class flavin-dependent oxidoreductase [Pirellulales bacterium]
MATQLKSGMFVMPIHNPEKPYVQMIDEDIELAIKCDELGFDDFWVGEHHSSTYENIVSPEIFLGKVLVLTSNIRIGPAPVCLAYHNPVHVANRLAFMDHLSHGRLNVCFGPGAVPTDLEAFNVAPPEIGRRVAEAIDVIMNIWTSDPPYEFKGEFTDFSINAHIDKEMGIGALHKPLQQPLPPIFVPSISRASKGLENAAAKGFNFISHHMIHADVLKDQWETYQRGAASAGLTPTSQNWTVTRNIVVAKSDEEARQFAREGSLGQCLEYILELTRRTAPNGVDLWKPSPDMSDEDLNMDYFMDEIVIAGTPETVTKQLLRLREAVGEFGNITLVAHCWDDKEKWMTTYELFANEVLPAVNSAL